MIEKAVWQDEKDFTLDVPVNLKNDQVYGKGKKPDVSNENLFAPRNKMSRKVMVSAAISWYDTTKLFFVTENGIKVDKENYCNHLKKQLCPAIKALVKCNDRIFIQDSVLSHRSNLVHDFLEKTLKHRLVKCVDLVKTKVYQGTAGEPFSSEELKTKIKAVWKDCATDLKPLQKAIKQLLPRL